MKATLKIYETFLKDLAWMVIPDSQLPVSYYYHIGGYNNRLTVGQDYDQMGNHYLFARYLQKPLLQKLGTGGGAMDEVSNLIGRVCCGLFETARASC